MIPTPTPTEGCWLVQIPNTSQWETVCTTSSTAGTVSVPALTEWGGLLFAVLLVALALRRLK